MDYGRIFIPLPQTVRMPELPDLQVFSHNLQKKLAGKKLKKLHVPVTKKLNVSVASLRKVLERQEIKKYIVKGRSYISGLKTGMCFACT